MSFRAHIGYWGAVRTIPKMTEYCVNDNVRWPCSSKGYTTIDGVVKRDDMYEFWFGATRLLEYAGGNLVCARVERRISKCNVSTRARNNLVDYDKVS